MDLSISGRSEGLAASSAINDFFLREGTATHALNHALNKLPAQPLPFEALGLYIEALNHLLPSDTPILVQPQKKLIRTHTGRLQKQYELTIGNAYYQLGVAARRERVSVALIHIADNLDAEFPPTQVFALTHKIRSAVQAYCPTAA